MAHFFYSRFHENGDFYKKIIKFFKKRLNVSLTDIKLNPRQHNLSFKEKTNDIR